MHSTTLNRLVSFIILISASAVANAEFYRCIDAGGKQRYQDKACAEGEQSQLIDLNQLGRKISVVESDPGYTYTSRLNRVRNAQFDQNLAFWSSERHAQVFRWIEHDGHHKPGAVAVQTTPPVDPQKNVIYEATLSQCVKLDRGRRYRFAASFKAMGHYTSQHANRVNLYWYQSEDCTTHGQFAEYLEPDPNVVGWQRITRDDELRSLNAKAALITIVQSRIGGNHQPAFWDDIELTPTALESTASETPVVNLQSTLPVGQNYLQNGEFDQSLTPWRYSGDTQWVSHVGSNAAGAARLAIASQNGGYGAHDLSQCVNLGANRVFAAGAKVMVDPVSTQEGGGIFRLSWYEGENCEGRSQAGFKGDRVKPVDGWQVLTIDRIEAPPGAQSANIHITRGVNDTGSFAFFFDDVYFKALAQ